MSISLNDFRAISSGEFNAGQIDFTTGQNGEVTGLKKVNNHVTLRYLNIDVIDRKRAVEVKEAFIRALSDEGVRPEKIAEIRAKLGIAAETKTSIAGAGAALERRFRPLTRQEVREILRDDVDAAAALNEGFIEGVGRNRGAAAAESKRVRDARERVNRQAEALAQKSPAHEILCSILSGKSCRETLDASLKNSTAMMQVWNCLKTNRMDTTMVNTWNRGVSLRLGVMAKTLAALRSAVDAFVADPDSEPQEIDTPAGKLTLARVPNDAMRDTRIKVTIALGEETMTLELEDPVEDILERLDGQISGGAALLGKPRLAAMLGYAEKNGDVAEDSDPCLGRTVAAAILKTYSNVGQDLVDEIDNTSLLKYAGDIVRGTGNWNEETIRAARNEALKDPDNVKSILDASNEMDESEDRDAIITTIVNRANEADKPNEIVHEEEKEIGKDNADEIKIEEPVVAPPEEHVAPQEENVVPQPPQKFTFDKIVVAPPRKDANDVTESRYEPLLRRVREERIFNAVSLMFERPKDAGRPADDRFASLKTGPLDAPKHFEAAQKTENFTFADAKLPQEKRKEIGDFALGLLNGAVSGDAAALKALVAQNLHAFLLMASDPDGAAAFFPPKAAADAKGLVASLAEALKDAAKAGAGRTIDFRSFTQGDEDAVRTMLERTKDTTAADALAGKFATILRETVRVTVLQPSDEVTATVGAALGGTSAAALAALARQNPLELMSFVSGDLKIAGRNAAQTAEIKAAVMKAFAGATGKTAFAELTLAEFDAFAQKCRTGLLEKTLGEIAGRNALFGGDLYKEVGGSAGKRVAAGAAPKDLGAVVKAPQTAEAKKGDVVGGVTLHIADMLDSDAPHPRNATAADLRGLAADFVETAEAILAKGANASPEALRAVMLKDIDAFCRFLDNPGALGNAVMPQLRELVAGAMADVRGIIDAALKAAIGKGVREARPVEIKAFVRSMDLATLGKLAAAFGTLAEKSAVQMQSFVNAVCKLDPKAKIVSEYDRMKPEEIASELAGKTLDDIIDDPINDPSRPGMLAFQKKVLSTYFTSVSRARKAGVLVSALRNAPETAQAESVAAETKFLSAIFLGAGPLMQKTLQSIDKRVAGAHAEAFAVLKSSIPPIPDDYIVGKLNEIVKNNPAKYQMLVPNNTKLFKPLGAATVGQAVWCQFMTPEGGVDYAIVKIMRPGVKERFEEDVKLFDAVAKEVPSVRKVWNARVATIRDEFDFRVEAKNIQIGQVYEVYDNRFVMVLDKKSGKMVPKVDPETGRNVRAPGVENTWTVSAMKTPEGVKQTSDVLVGSVARGEPFDKVLSAQTREIHALFAGVFETDADGRIVRRDGRPVVRKDMNFYSFLDIHGRIAGAVDNIASSGVYFKQVVWKWVEEALFKSGVMHNDVHTGNLMLDTEAQCATFIDFGNVVTLTQKERVSLLKMVAAVAAKHSDFFIKSFAELLGKGTPEEKSFMAQYDKVHAAVKAVIHKGHSSNDTGYRFQALLCEMQKLGVDIPPKLAAFVEGLTRLQSCHEELADLLKETESLYRAYETQVLKGGPVLNEPDPDDDIGRLLVLLAKPNALESIKTVLTGTGDELRMQIREARVKVMDYAWEAKGGVPEGSLIDRMKAAIEEEKDLPGNAKLAHLASLVTRHASAKDAANIDAALACFADVKRRLRAAVASGAKARAAELGENLAAAQETLLRRVLEAMTGILMAIDAAVDASAPDDCEFNTVTAAEIFARIVDENVDSVKKAFSGLADKGKIVAAFRRARKDNVNHTHDGHQKLTTNKL